MLGLKIQYTKHKPIFYLFYRMLRKTTITYTFPIFTKIYYLRSLADRHTHPICAVGDEVLLCKDGLGYVPLLMRSVTHFATPLAIRIIFSCIFSPDESKS